MNTRQGEVCMVAPTLLNDHFFTSFQTKTSIFFLVSHWILAHFNFRQEWRSLEIFSAHRFKGVTPLGRHTRPACN